MTNSQRYYEVGKGKPPVAHQFKPGHSGNPEGARRKRKSSPDSLASIRDMSFKVLNQPIKTTLNGKLTTMLKGDAILLQFVNDALHGPPHVRLKAMKFFKDIGAFDNRITQQPPDAEARKVFFERLAKEAE